MRLPRRSTGGGAILFLSLQLVVERSLFFVGSASGQVADAGDGR